MHNEKFRGPKEMKKLLRLRLTNYMPNNYVSLFQGIFFVLPCIESYQKVDLRTITLGVPPQEVRYTREYSHLWSKCNKKDISLLGW